MKPGVKTWPGVVYDCRAAVQFVRANAAEFDLDPERIGMIGDSAGAHLSALVALAGNEPLFSSEYRNDPCASTWVTVKAVVGFYGVYDMQAQWEHDQITRPRDSVTEKLLGCPPMVSRKTFFEASPLSFATVDKNSTRFLLIYGREDDIVDPATQSEKFLTALKQAGFFARTIVVPGAGHFWSVDPVEEPGSFGASSDSWKLAQRAEELGFTHAWFFDTQMITGDCFVAMAAAALKTSRIRLGTGVLVPSNRIAAVTANAFATLNGIAPGRIDFGIGTGFSARR